MKFYNMPSSQVRTNNKPCSEACLPFLTSFDVPIPPNSLDTLILGLIRKTNYDNDQVSCCMPLLSWLLPSS